MKKAPTKTESNVCECSWQVKSGEFVLECRKPTKARVSGRNLDDAKEELLSKIMEKTGDGQPFLQFDSPLPERGDIGGYFSPEYFEVGYNDLVECEHASGTFFHGGVCKGCGSAMGLRDAKVRRMVTTAPKYDIAGLRNDKNLRYIVSGRMLSHILPYIESQVECIPVDFDERTRKRVKLPYFELDFAAKNRVVFPVRHENLLGWRCKLCKTMLPRVMASHIASGSLTCVSRKAAIGDVVLLSKGPKRTMLINSSIKRKIMGDKSIKGFVADRAAVLDSIEIMSQMELEKLNLPKP